MLQQKEEGGRLRVQSMPVGKSRTEQQHRDVCNINSIVKKARKGIPVRVNKGTGLYGDFSGFEDYHSTLNRINDALLDFQALPSHIRARFKNDPGQLLEFIANPESEKEARELGLLPEGPARPLEGSASSDLNEGKEPGPAEAITV